VLECQSVIVSECQIVRVSECQSVRVSEFQSVRVSECQSVSVSVFQNVRVSYQGATCLTGILVSSSPPGQLSQPQPFPPGQVN
jgi:hypothetical protein